MNRIVEKFAQLKKAGKKGFVVYIGAGDPNLEATRQLALAFDQAGVDILELGVPFFALRCSAPWLGKVFLNARRLVVKCFGRGRIISVFTSSQCRSRHPSRPRQIVSHGLGWW